MKNYVFCAFIALLIFLDGLIVGVAIDGNNFLPEKFTFYDFFKDSLAFFLSGVTLYLAYKALDRWKKQHFFNEQYYAAVELEKKFRNLHAILINILLEYSNNSNFDLYSSDAYKGVAASFNEYKLAYVHLASLADRNVLTNEMKIAPLEIVNKFYEIATKLMHQPSSSEERLKTHEAYRVDAVHFINDVIPKLRKLRPKN